MGNTQCTALSYCISAIIEGMYYAMQPIWEFSYLKTNNMPHIPSKKGICAHIFNVRALDAKQRIDFFGLKPPYEGNYGEDLR